MSEASVKAHVSRLLAKLGAANRVQVCDSRARRRRRLSRAPKAHALADSKECAGHVDHVALDELPATSDFDLAVHPYRFVGEQCLDVRTLLDGIGQLQELAEPDPVAGNADLLHGPMLSRPERANRPARELVLPRSSSDVEE
jgi:hypothetical protein